MLTFRDCHVYCNVKDDLIQGVHIDGSSLAGRTADKVDSLDGGKGTVPGSASIAALDLPLQSLTLLFLSFGGKSVNVGAHYDHSRLPHLCLEHEKKSGTMNYSGL